MDTGSVIYIYENCDEQVAAGIRQFSSLKAGYSTASKRRSIWPQLAASLDGAVVLFASSFNDWPSATLFLEADGISQLGPAWLAAADGVVEQDYIQGKRLVKHSLREDLVPFVETLASLREVAFAALSHGPAHITVKGCKSSKGGVRLQTKSKGDDHYPFCELCWRYSEAVNNLSPNERDSLSSIEVREKRNFESEAGVRLGSLRFCSIHNPAESAPRYRADVGYRGRFGEAITECKRCFVKANKLLLAEYDAATPFAEAQVLGLYGAGFSVDQIMAITSRTYPAVVSALTNIHSTEYQSMLAAETRFAIPSEKLIRQAAYLLVHEDVVALMALESEAPVMATLALGDLIQDLFDRKLSVRTREIVRLSLSGIANADIAAQLGVSRQVVQNALSRELATAFKSFLNFLADRGAVCKSFSAVS
jgi:hypothetical protein